LSHGPEISGGRSDIEQSVQKAVVPDSLNVSQKAKVAVALEIQADITDSVFTEHAKFV
jgi:hypothetical protein